MNPLGYDINTGEPIYKEEDMLVHIGLGYYEKKKNITKEVLERRARFFTSLDIELNFKKKGFEES